MQEEYEIYGGFASVYDEFMDNIPYDAWAMNILWFIKKNMVYRIIVVDIACGTGEITRRLSRDGYDIVRERYFERYIKYCQTKCDPDVLLLYQDMRQMDLYGTAAMVCAVMEWISVQERKICTGITKSKTFMDHGGIFIFDMKTPYFYQDILGDRTITDNQEVLQLYLGKFL